MTMAGINDFVINNELTERATLSEDLLKRVTVGVSELIPIQINDEEAASGKKDSAPSGKKQYYQRFLEFKYPGGSNRGIILPNVVVHHQLSDYFNKTSVSFGVPQYLVRLLEPRISAAGATADFKDRRLASDEKYWWTRSSFSDAPEGKEYIRVCDDDEEDYFGSFSDFFAEYPTSVIANVTCSVKMTCEVDMGQEPKKGDYWRAALRVTMVTPIDSIDIPAPQSGNNIKSISGKKDAMKSGLKSKRIAN